MRQLYDFHPVYLIRLVQRQANLPTQNLSCIHKTLFSSLMALLMIAAVGVTDIYASVMAPPTSLDFDERSSVNDAIDDNTFPGQFVGRIIPAGGDAPFTYSLVAGEGDTNNALFSISSDSLFAAQFIDFETLPTSLSIRVRAADATDAGFEQAIALTIRDIDESTTAGFGSQGDEFLVNDFSPSIQQRPAIARDANGNFVVVWQNQEDGIFAQRYDATATPVGDELRVDNPSNNNQKWADVDMADNGDFVVVWQGTGNAGGNGTDIIARLYAADGTPGNEFIVNTVTAGEQDSARVAMNATGDFIVAWQGSGDDGNALNGVEDANGIFFRRFQANGTAIDATQVAANTTTAGAQYQPAVGLADDGKFAVSWTSAGDIIYRFYTVTPTLAGSAEATANNETAGGQSLSDLSMRDNGAFMVTWQGEGTGDTNGIYARRFNNNGSPTAAQLTVSAPSDDQFAPHVSMANNGTFAITFTGPGSGNEVLARRYNADRSPIDDAFEVNKLRLGVQRFSDIALGEDGGFVVAWEGFTDAGNYDIYAQRFYTNAAPTAIALDNQTVANGSLEGTPVGTFSTTDPNAGDKFSYALVAGDGDTDNATFAIQGNQLVTAVPINATLPASFSVRVRSTDALGLSVESAFTIDVGETQIPTIVANTGLTIVQNDTAAITATELEVTDAESGPEALTYTITQVPVNGVLQKSEVTLEASGTFTQADINGGLITYIHDGSQNLADSLKFTVSDGTGGSIPETNFAITVTAAANEAPVVAVNTGVSVAQGDTAVVSQNVLEVTDVDGSPEAITYTLVGIPANGTLQRNNTVLAANETFTQADINNETITYVHDGGASTEDSFSFTAADGAGGSIEETTVAITVTAVGTPIANAGTDQVVIDEDNDGIAEVILDGSASSDPDGTIEGYAWIENDTDTVATDVNPITTITLAVGVHTIALVVTDNNGLTASDTVVVTVNAPEPGENTVPVIVTNAGLSLPQQGDTVVITSNELSVTDAESGPEAITYTLTKIPINGSLQRDGIDLAVDDTFTQQDIDDGLIRYANSGASEGNDTFNFTVADANGGAIAETEFAISINVITSLGNEIDESVVVVYPNPSQQSLYIKMKSSSYGDVHVQISNSMGQVLKSVQLNGQMLEQSPIDIGNLSKGTYFVRVDADQQTIIKKLIKE